MNSLLSVKETACLLGISTSTLYGWVHRKKIPYVKINGKLAFIEEQIEEFIEQNNYIPDQ